jgi:AcrR family transcriptional regulator
MLQRELDLHLREIGRADILVGIPSYNNARTIGHVVRMVQEGLATHFPDARTVLLNSDGGSSDGTPDVVRSLATGGGNAVTVEHRVLPFYKVSVPYHGLPGKGSAFRTIFQAAEALGARACAVVDSDLRSITPRWMDLLLRPVWEGGFHFVAPLYYRHKFDGTITNGIIYPFSRALYGCRIRQPIGGDFGFSGELARRYLAQEVWETDVARYGIDIWMTTNAVAWGYAVCQVFLGAKLHDPKDPGSDLSSMLRQVVGAAFDLMETHTLAWKGLTGSRQVPTIGVPHQVDLEQVNVDTERMFSAFRLGVRDLAEIWAAFLPAGLIRDLGAMAAAPPGRFRFTDDLWAEVIVRMALAFHRRSMNRDHLLRSLTPLYLGRTGSFVLAAKEASAEEVEAMIEDLCLSFESAKRILEENW